MKKVSAIVCAFNEERTLENVLRSVSKSPLINETIVVNDGSIDETANIIERLKQTIEIEAIHFKKNKGKGFAMASGIEKATGDIVVFIDADMDNLTGEHFSQLLTPIISKEADMVLGQPSETLINYSINPFKSFTGQRAVLKEDISPIVEKIKYSRFGVETLINLYYQSEGRRVKNVMLRGLIHPTKFDKTTSSQAIKEYVKEGHQIAITAFKNFDLITKTIKKTIF